MNIGIQSVFSLKLVKMSKENLFDLWEDYVKYIKED